MQQKREEEHKMESKTTDGQKWRVVLQEARWTGGMFVERNLKFMH